MACCLQTEKKPAPPPPGPAVWPVMRVTTGTRTGVASQQAWEAGEFVNRCGCLMPAMDSNSRTGMINLVGASSRVVRSLANSNQQAIRDMHNATGVRFLIHGGIYKNNVTPTRLPATPAEILATVKAIGIECFLAVSSVNEPNHANKMGDVTEYWNFLRDYQQELWETFNSDPVTNNGKLLVLGPGWAFNDKDLISPIGNIDQWIHGHQCHSYPTAIFRPERAALYDSFVEAFKTGSSTKPVFIGETGYHTGSAEWGTTDAVAYKSRFMPRLFLYHFDHGAASIVNYTMNWTGEPAPSWSAADSEAAYGWLRDDGSVQASYTSCKNLFTVLADPGPRFTPGTLAYTITGTLTDVSYVLMQKRNGRFYLAVWVATYDNATRPIVINLPTSIASARINRPNTNATWATQAISTNRITYTADGFVTIFELVPSAPPVDITAPTPPSNPSGVAVTGTRIDLTWTASTDNVAVTGYRIERCTGTTCSNFVEIGTSTSAAYSDTTVSPAITYRYRVRAFDAAGNLSGYSATVTATTLSGGGIVPPILIGVSLAGGEFGTVFPGTTPTDYAFAADSQYAYFASVGMTAIRIPIKWERCVAGVPGGALNAAYMALVDTAIERCTSRGMRPIIDLHNYHRFNLAGVEHIIGSTTVTRAHFVDLWTRLAQRYAGNPLVVFGLMNEPHDVTGGAAAIFADQQAAISAIRTVPASNFVLVSGGSWSTAAQWVSSGNAAAALSITDPLNNFAFEVHQYLDATSTGTSTTCAVGTGAGLGGDGVFRLKPAVDWALNNSRRLFLGEFSWAPNTTCNTWAADMMAYVRANQSVVIGATYWAAYPDAYGPHDSNPQLLNPLTGGVDRTQISTLLDTEPPPPTTEFGDHRNASVVRVYPTSMLLANGGRVLNVRQAPFNAVGDGVADDSNALIAAYDYVVDQLTAVVGRGQANTHFIIYVPSGTYRVTKEIVYTGTVNEGEELQYIRWVGQNRTNTIIRLDNGAFGSTQKAVISFTKQTLNALETKSALRNMTIDVGTNNAGASAVRLSGANSNEVCDMTLKAGTNSGRYGIMVSGISQFWIHDCTIDGFDVGIDEIYHRATGSVVEHVTFRNQRTAAMRTASACFAIRDVLSENTAPALLHTDVGAFSAVVDSHFSGGAAGNAAVQIDGGALFARGVSTQGYGSAVKTGSVVRVQGPAIEEFKYPGATLSLWGETSSIPLPAADVPIVAWPAAADWAVVAADGQAAAQTALDSGKPGVMFKNFTHNIGTCVVPASVKRINAAYADLSGTFNLGADSNDPILFEEIYGVSVQQNGKNRVVILNQGGSFKYLNGTPKDTDKAFLCCLSTLGTYTINKMQVWCRQLNTEPKNLPLDVGVFNWGQGARVWHLGYKTESNSTSHRVTGGSKLEIIGGFSNQTYFVTEPNPDSIIIDSTDSQVSVSIHTTGHSDNVGYERAARAIHSGTTRTMPYTDCPVRSIGNGHQLFMPLYVESLP